MPTPELLPALVPQVLRVPGTEHARLIRRLTKDLATDKSRWIAASPMVDLMTETAPVFLSEFTWGVMYTPLDLPTEELFLFCDLIHRLVDRSPDHYPEHRLWLEEIVRRHIDEFWFCCFMLTGGALATPPERCFDPVLVAKFNLLVAQKLLVWVPTILALDDADRLVKDMIKVGGPRWFHMWGQTIAQYAYGAGRLPSDEFEKLREMTNAREAFAALKEFVF